MIEYSNQSFMPKACIPSDGLWNWKLKLIC
ncbi:MAG: hypothetical protein K0R51_3567 [Cytophagaceae bacterium]|jgi:hypothetical protein|nr:hypothetical protein [Cytophagaceae bacterium]